MSNAREAKHPLLDILHQRKPALAAQADLLIGEAHRVLEYTISTFAGGTDHTSRHTTTVERIGRMLLTDEFLAALNDHELFFLSLACHYHDLAMAGTEAEEQTPETREQARRDHAIRIGTRIKEKWAELGFEDQRIAEVLGEVCRGHGPKKNAAGEANWDELNPHEVLGPGVAVRVRLLSALTYAIDELHLGADRAPQRVQNWREIRNEEDRRHWRRHQAVSGPSTLAGGTLLFQVATATPGFEEYLRARVFDKALSAVRDLARQAQLDGVAASLSPIAIQWERREVWGLLLPVVCSDLRPRTRADIEQALLAEFTAGGTARTDLSSLCIEQGNSEVELRNTAARCVGDAITCGQLVATSDSVAGFVLSTQESVANDLFRRTRNADELDRLFLGSYCPSWEERLFRSVFGRSYVTNCVLPGVHRLYSLQLAQHPPDYPCRVVLERCPTAARLVLAYFPPSGNWVKSGLLKQAVLTGALYDLHADPNRILDSQLRSAIYALAEAKDTRALLRVIEELALIGGLTTDQIADAHHVSEPAREAIERDDCDGPTISLSVTQSIPPRAPPALTHISRLMLASRRAGVELFVADEPPQSSWSPS